MYHLLVPIIINHLFVAIIFDRLM